MPFCQCVITTGTRLGEVCNARTTRGSRCGLHKSSCLTLKDVQVGHLVQRGLSWDLITMIYQYTLKYHDPTEPIRGFDGNLYAFVFLQESSTDGSLESGIVLGFFHRKKGKLFFQSDEYLGRPRSFYDKPFHWIKQYRMYGRDLGVVEEDVEYTFIVSTDNIVP